jgi:hypothetical protein
MSKSNLSYDAKIVWDSLSKSQQRAIQKNNPIRGDRNKIIRELKNRKVKVKILAEISGLCRMQVIRITRKHIRIPGDKLSLVKHRLSEVRDRIDRAIREIDGI